MNYSDIKNIRKYDWFELSNYEPHPGQRLIHDSNARFRLVSAGRRWGKSLSAAREAECFLLKPNTRGWIVSKTYDLGEKVFREIYRNMIVRFRLQPRKKSNSVKSGNMFLEFPWDSVVEVKSESNPESLLGEGLDWLIFDECAGADRKTWEMYLRPTLSDKQGKAIFISTPRGASNWFYEFYRRGLNQEVYPDWFSISSPTWDNPYIPAKEIEDARQTLSKPTFDQEYGAMFTVPSGLVYEEFSETVHVVPSSEIKIDKNCKFYKWIDFGYADPFVVLYVMETGDNRLFIFDEIYERRKSTDQIADMIYAKDDELYWKYDIKQSYKEDNEWINVADPSGASCRASLRDRKIYTVIPKKKDIKEQIELVRQELKLRDDGKPSLFVSKKCVETIREFISYAYTEDGGDKPIDDNNHTLDPSSYGLRVIRKGYIHQGIGVY